MGIGIGVKKKAVFLDRDGVLNDAVVRDGKPYPPDSLATLRISKEVPKALHALKQADFLLICVTNQPDVARGKTLCTIVETINTHLLSSLPLDNIYVCYHDDIDMCDCRKPLPGLLMRAASQYGIDLCRSFMIGDRWKDIEAGKNAGCKTVWLNYNYQEAFFTAAPDYTTSSIIEAVDWIINYGVRGY
jgi:D-glycero-D-manno-heptose 1,7-bisphosphate phosphatase